MSPKKRIASKTGKMHSCDRAAPCDEHSHEEPSFEPRKPDLDERERLSTPDRKAAGPSTRKRRKAKKPITPSVTPDVLPKALSKGGKKSNKS